MITATHPQPLNLLHALVFVAAAAPWTVVLVELAKVSLR
jgi:hypothetical protein